MSTAIMERPTDAKALPKDQIDLIKRTVASGATNDELALFLYDCDRRGIHPLDKLLHFTKRGGRYTPVTSIDFMRSQAAASGEMAGSDDPVFLDDGGKPSAASVTVYRMTQGQRFAYTATARWSEYCPDNAPMWKRMPHTMLGKCAEALALRKAFPQQLAGLYSREEMDQADEPKAGYVVTAPAPLEKREKPAAATVEDRGTSDDGPSLLAADLELPAGYVLIERVDLTPTKNPNITRALITVSTGETYSTIKPQLAAQCEQFAQNRTPVCIGPDDFKVSKYGNDLIAVHTQKENLDLDAEAVRADMARAGGDVL